MIAIAIVVWSLEAQSGGDRVRVSECRIIDVQLQAQRIDICEHITRKEACQTKTTSQQSEVMRKQEARMMRNGDSNSTKSQDRRVAKRTTEDMWS